MSPSIGGGTFVWTGAGSDGNWTTGGNWQGGVAPIGNGNSTLVFPSGALQLTNTDNLPASGDIFAGLNISGSGYNIKFNNPLVLVSGGVSVTAAGTDAITAASNGVNIYLVSGESFSTVNGTTLTIAPNITELSGALTIAGAGNTVFDGLLAGPGGLTATDTGTLTLNGASTYTGPTQISSGTVTVNTSTALGSNSDVTVAAGAIVNVAGTTSLQIGSLAGGGRRR